MYTDCPLSVSGWWIYSPVHHRVWSNNFQQYRCLVMTFKLNSDWKNADRKVFTKQKEKLSDSNCKMVVLEGIHEDDVYNYLSSKQTNLIETLKVKTEITEKNISRVKK